MFSFWGTMVHHWKYNQNADLKRIIERQIRLGFPDPSRDRQFCITSDASDDGWAAVIGQIDKCEEELEFEDRSPTLRLCGGVDQFRCFLVHSPLKHASIVGDRSLKGPSSSSSSHLSICPITAAHPSSLASDVMQKCLSLLWWTLRK